MSLVATIFKNYVASTPARLRMCDCFLVYALLTALVQFVYVLLVGTFPFNSFLSGFFACLGFFVLTVCLRMTVNPANKSIFRGLSPERAFAEYAFCNIVLYLTVINFLG